MAMRSCAVLHNRFNRFQSIMAVLVSWLCWLWRAEISVTSPGDGDVTPEGGGGVRVLEGSPGLVVLIEDQLAHILDSLTVISSGWNRIINDNSECQH